MHPLVLNKHDLVSVGTAIGSVVFRDSHPKGWWIGFLAGFAMLQILAISVCYLFYMGTGIWGINVPVAWGFAIINFVWWIGIGHAGTLISAILLLLHQKWRTSINRFSEAMTIFAVMCAGLFPLLHMGRPWFFYWLYPFPNVAGVYPQFRSRVRSQAESEPFHRAPPLPLSPCGTRSASRTRVPKFCLCRCRAARGTQHSKSCSGRPRCSDRGP